MSGGAPMLADAQRGTIRGDSFTFYSRDDRVLVESDEFSPHRYPHSCSPLMQTLSAEEIVNHARLASRQ